MGRGGARGGRNRSHARPTTAVTPAAASAARVAKAIERLCHDGFRIEDLALELKARPLDVARWRRGRGAPGYRREEIEAALARLKQDRPPAQGSP